jgi:hypothetical protein
LIASIYCRSDGHSSSSRETCVTLVSDAFESDDNTHTTRSSRSSNGSTDVTTIDSIDDNNNNNNNSNNNNNKQIFKGAVIKGILNGTSRYVKRPSFQNESKSGILFKDYDS